ncbi:MAG: hypothetical protein FJ030_00695 [Chloroflexi bacterium]|nr:hypothetical protein [Chloroflexota bacterium]
MRLNPALTITIAVVAAAVLLGAAWVILKPAGPALASAEFSLSAISPNADGLDDITRITYRLRRPTSVSIYFLDSGGARYNFRADNPRDSGEHTLLFSGIVDGYPLAGDDNEAALLKRVLQNRSYTWVIEATESNGETTRLTGTLTVTDSDTALPHLRNLTASPALFTPNQDGINDRATINVWLGKDIPEDNLRVTLIGRGGEQYPIAEAGTDVLPGREGLHTYDYDGGIDNGVNPPPDGDYIVRAEAEDAIGQKMQIETALKIQNSGLPRAEIYLGEVEWSSATVVIGQTLEFTLTVENYGTAPIRTFGPWSGTMYDQEQNSNTLGFYEEDGAWRVGVDCDSCIRDYPWRWALGTPETLTPIVENGETHYYLMPNQRAVITGSVTLTQVIDARNPQYFWAGLIHEAVGITNINNRVDPKQITIEKP